MDDIRKRLSQHRPGLIGMESCQKSAVCIPLIRTEEGYEVLFEVRSSKIDSQPGDICFPGGMLEAGETPREAAVREMCEELLVRAEQIEVLGLTDVLFTGLGLMLYPYAVILDGYTGTYSADEVAETFTVPLRFFLENEPLVYQTEATVDPGEDFPYNLIHKGREYAWRKRREDVFFYLYEKYAIWGLTARIVRSFAGILRGNA